MGWSHRSAPRVTSVYDIICDKLTGEFSCLYVCPSQITMFDLNSSEPLTLKPLVCEDAVFFCVCFQYSHICPCLPFLIEFTLLSL